MTLVPAENNDGAIVPCDETTAPAPTGKWDVIARIAPYMNAVCRILPRAGTAVLVSRQGNRGVLLTTSAVLSCRADAHNKEAIFFETETLGASKAPGAGVKRNTAGVKVALRPDRLFFTSVSAGSAVGGEAASLGYSVVACDVVSVNGESGGTLHSVVPIPLPIILSKVPPVCEGDCQLFVSFADGGPQRRYYVSEVGAVFESHAVHTEIDQATTVATGGPVFNSAGEFVGLQHMTSASCSYCVFIKDIVSHMYESLVLGQVRVLIETSNPEDMAEFGCRQAPGANADASQGKEEGGNGHYTLPVRFEHDGTRTGWSSRRDGGSAENDDAMMAMRDGGAAETAALSTAAPTSRVMAMVEAEGPFGTCGGMIIANPMHVEMVHQRRLQPQRGTLVIPTDEDVWKEHYDPEDYHSLVLILHAFYYHKGVLRRAVNTLTAMEHRHEIDQLSRLGGVGILLEALDALPYDEHLMSTAMACVARVSLYSDNREALSKYSGTITTLSILSEYQHTPMVVQWGCYVLYSLCHDTQGEMENRRIFAAHGGIQFVVRAMKAAVDELMKEAIAARTGHATPKSARAVATQAPMDMATHPGPIRFGSPHLLRWGGLLLACVIDGNKVHFDIAVEDQLLGTLYDLIRCALAPPMCSSYSLFGLLTLACTLMKHDSFEAAGHFFARTGLTAVLVDTLRQFGGIDTEDRVTEVALHAMHLLLQMEPRCALVAVSLNVDDVVSRCAMTFLSHVAIHEHVGHILMMTHATNTLDRISTSVSKHATTQSRPPGAPAPVARVVPTASEDSPRELPLFAAAGAPVVGRERPRSPIHGAVPGDGEFAAMSKPEAKRVVDLLAICPHLQLQVVARITPAAAGIDYHTDDASLRHVSSGGRNVL